MAVRLFKGLTAWPLSWPFGANRLVACEELQVSTVRRGQCLMVGVDVVKNNRELRHDAAVKLHECGEEPSCSVQGVSFSKRVHCTNCTKEVIFR